MPYRTEDLRFFNEPRVKPTSFPPYKSSFFICGIACLAGKKNPRWFYLHKDGLWRNIATSDTGLSGYFDSRRDAERTLNASSTSLQRDDLFMAKSSDLEEVRSRVRIWEPSLE